MRAQACARVCRPTAAPPRKTMPAVVKVMSTDVATHSEIVYAVARVPAAPTMTPRHP